MLKLLMQDWFHPDGFPIAVERREPQEPFGLHCHEFSEIVIITGGKGRHIAGQDSYELSVGDTFVIGGERPHDYLNMDHLSLVNVLFNPAELHVDFTDLLDTPGYRTLFSLEPAWRKRHEFQSRLRLTAGELVQAIEIVDHLDRELKKREPGFRAASYACWLQLVTFLSRCYREATNKESKALLRIAETILYIERNYEQPITLESLVEMSGMSRRSFIRAFESAMGCPPIAYVIRQRIRNACVLLRETSKSITEIAFEVGFSDSNYFSRQFRAVLGVSPNQFRKLPFDIAKFFNKVEPASGQYSLEE